MCRKARGEPANCRLTFHYPNHVCRTHYPLMNPSPYHSADIVALQVIIKTVERCNLACSYCYVFEGTDHSWRRHDPVITRQTIAQIASFLETGLKSMPGIRRLSIAFHGGEPTMQKKGDFAWMCETLRGAVPAHVACDFAMQSNGLLIDAEWACLLAEHDVACSISLDGPREYHDVYRKDHHGRSSYDATVAGLQCLQAEAARQGAVPPSVICVVNPDMDARQIYRHFVDDLRVESMNFLLPDVIDHRRPTAAQVERAGRYLCDLFEAWAEEDDPDIQVGVHRDLMSRFLGSDTMSFPDLTQTMQRVYIVVSSSGHVTPDDVLRNTQLWKAEDEPTVRDITLESLLSSPLLHQIYRAARTVPNACDDCIWRSICGGGWLSHRFDSEQGFNSSSVWCGSLMPYFERVFDYLVRSGVAPERLRQSMESPTTRERMR